MERSRNLKLGKESLADLGTDELRLAVGGDGTDLCNPCTVTWSCDDIKTLYCLQTRVNC